MSEWDIKLICCLACKQKALAEPVCRRLGNEQHRSRPQEGVNSRGDAELWLFCACAVSFNFAQQGVMPGGDLVLGEPREPAFEHAFFGPDD